MADFHAQLEQTRDRITENQRRIEESYRDIGRRMLETPPEKTSTQFDELTDKIREIDETTEGYDALITRIREIEARLTDIKEQLATDAEQIRRIEKENSAYYESIGEAAYAHYRRNPEVAEQYSAVFQPVVDIHEELSSIAQEIETAEEELTRKSFFDKVVVRGRLALLRTRQANKEGSIPKLFYRIGERIVGTEFPNEADSADLNQAMEPYRENARRIQEIEQRRSDLERERERLATELEESGATRRPAKRIREIESLRAENVSRRAELLTELGKTALEIDNAVDSSAPEVAQIDAAQDSITTDEQRIERLEAAITVDQLESRIGQIAEDVEQKNGRISELKKEVTQLKKQKSQLESERDQALEKRGDLEELAEPAE